jgi:hypothetical protein
MVSRNMVWMHSTINKKSDYELFALSQKICSDGKNKF